MRLVFLGTGATRPTAQRNTAALALELGEQTVLFDCGEGTQRQLDRAGIPLGSIQNIFLTHLHGDHILGLPGLLWAMEHQNEGDRVSVFGPPGTRWMLGRFAQLVEPAPPLPVRVVELGDRARVRVDRFDVLARRLDHTDPNLGYAVVDPDDDDDRLLAYTGDCRPDQRTVQLVRGADVLVHEATFARDSAMANLRGHSTARQAGEIARQANVRRLYLTHISARFPDPAPIEATARSVFSDAEVAEDLATVEIQG